jgi:hypothetical protein
MNTRIVAIDAAAPKQGAPAADQWVKKENLFPAVPRRDPDAGDSRYEINSRI